MPRQVSCWLTGLLWHARWWSLFAGAGSVEGGLLGKLNGDKKFDLDNTLLHFFGNNLDSNPYFDHPNNHVYVDNSNFFKALQNNSAPFMLSLNIQSLNNSKFEKLKNFILSLTNKNIQIVIDLIALQETWTIKHPQLLAIPGFQPLIFTNRKKGRGVGWASI